MCVYTRRLCPLLCQIRRVACDQLYTLSQSDTSAFPEVQKPNLFLLSVILTAQLPLWSPTSVMRGVNQRYLKKKYTRYTSMELWQRSCVDVAFFLRLLSQCTEYFDLRCQLLDDLTSKPINSLFGHFYQYVDMKYCPRCKN